MLGFISRLSHDRSGATAIEYGLIAALVAVGAIAALVGFGSSATAMYSFISNESNRVISSARSAGGL